VSLRGRNRSETDTAAQRSEIYGAADGLGIAMSRRVFGGLGRGPCGYDYGRRGIGIATVGGGGALNRIGLVLTGGITRGSRRGRLDRRSDVHDLIALATRRREE
jgi:hypothetical protein